MKFWKGNQVSGEFDWPVQAVADAFCIAVTKDAWPAKIESQPLERVLRDWLTAKDGFDSVWEAEHGPDSFDELYQIVRKQVRS